MINYYLEVLNFNWVFLKLMSRSHQRLCLVSTVKLLGTMLSNKCWPTTFHTTTIKDDDK